MDGMTMQDFAAMRTLEHEKTQGWGGTTALWVLVAAIIIFAIVYNWTKNCNEKVLFATGLSQLQGRMDCMSPKVDELGRQNYGTAQTLSGTVSSLAYVNRDLNQLNESVFYGDDGCGCGNHRGGRGGGGCGCGNNRRFDQRSYYTPEKTEVIVSESCQN